MLFIFSLSVSIKLSTRVAFIFFCLFVVCLLFLPFFLLLLTFLHLVWKSRFREQKTKNVALRVQMFRIIPTGCFCFYFWERAGGFRACEGSFFVENKCMARGSLKRKKTTKKKKSYFLSHTFAMAAHIPQSHGDENHCLQSTTRKKQNHKKNQKKDRMDESVSFLSSLQCYHFALLSFQPHVFFCFFFSRFSVGLLF